MVLLTALYLLIASATVHLLRFVVVTAVSFLACHSQQPNIDRLTAESAAIHGRSMRRFLLLSLLLAVLLLLLQLSSTAHAHEQPQPEDGQISPTVPTTIDQDEYDTTRSAFDPSSTPHPPSSASASAQQRKSRKLSSDFQASPLSQPTPKDKTRATSSPIPAAAAVPAPTDFAGRLLSFGVLDAPSGGWWFELLAVSLFVAYVVSFVYGRRVNDRLADTVFSSLVPLLSSQFAVVGAYDPHMLAAFAGQLQPLSSHANVLVYKESANNYQLYCSGRRNCSGLLLTLECVKRHDLLSRLLSFFSLAQERDQLTVDCSLEAMQPFILAVVKRKYETRMKKNVADLKMFTELKKPMSIPLPASLSLMTDSVEASEAVLSERTRATLSKHESAVILLHISDQAIPSHLSSSRRIMHFKCYLPTLPALIELMTLICGLVDGVSGVRLSGLALSKAVERRRLAEELEAKKKEKAEDGKKGEAKTETPEERAEREEKKRKKDEKKMRPKIKMMK